MFFKVGVLKNFANFTWKHILKSLFNKVAGLRSCNFIRKRLRHRCFAVKFEEFLRTTFLKNTSSGCFCSWTLSFSIMDFESFENNVIWLELRQCIEWYKEREYCLLYGISKANILFNMVLDLSDTRYSFNTEQIFNK